MGFRDSARQALRRHIDDESAGILVAPGAVDALSARLVEQAGFPAVYATGAGIVNSQFAVPDLGLATMTEILQQVQRMVQATELPVIADIDTGFGNPVNVYRTVQEFDRAGVAAIQIEDQVMPKKCGHFAGKEVVPAEEMVAKITSATEARSETGPLVIARTDAIATDGFDDAIRRANMYREAGADLIFMEAMESREEMKSVPQLIDAPLVVNMTEGGRTPLCPAEELQQMGYSLVIFPNALMRTAAFAMREALSHLRKHGSSEELLPKMLSWEERQTLVNIGFFQELEQRFVHRDEAGA
jgi:2-methylisocitrate lyase-like PEP mutase family enzyme